MANEIENALDALYDFETILGYALSHKDVPDLMQMVVNIRTALKQSSAEVVTVDALKEAFLEGFKISAEGWNFEYGANEKAVEKYANSYVSRVMKTTQSLK